MPTYCNSCPYNKFCKDLYLQHASCTMGYTPIGHTNNVENISQHGSVEHSGHILETSILMKIGKSAMNRDDYTASKECFEKILEIKPGDPEAGFLIKRVIYMINDLAVSEGGTGTVDASASVEAPKQPQIPIEQSRGMLPLQEEKSIKIKPKSQFTIDPNIINTKTENVYSVEDNEDVISRENVSKNVAQRSKGSVLKKRGGVVILGLTMVIIIVIVIGLWLSGLL